MASIPAKTRIRVSGTYDVASSLWQLARSTRQAISCWFRSAERAHELRRASDAVWVETMRDTGMDPETASGIQVWQADHPFFMQSGFGKR
ncbi:MAG: hypothetical protein ABIR04_02820 [Cypionkella sp.]